MTDDFAKIREEIYSNYDDSPKFCLECLDTALNFRINKDNKISVDICPCSLDRLGANKTYSLKNSALKFNDLNLVWDSENLKKYLSCSQNVISHTLKYQYKKIEIERNINKKDFYESDKILKTIKNVEIFIDDYQYPKELKTNDTLALHLFVRSGVFQIISTKERSAVSRLENQVYLDLPHTFTFNFMSAMCCYTGPYLCTFDEKILMALIKIYTDNSIKGLKINTSLNDIGKYLNYKQIGGAQREKIKRSLKRLAKGTIEAQNDKVIWVGHLINNLIIDEKIKINPIHLEFNRYLIQHLLWGAYANFDMRLIPLLSEWAFKVALVVNSHDWHEFKLSVESFRNQFKIPAHRDEIIVKKQITKILKELIKHNVLNKDSCLSKNIIHFIKIKKERAGAHTTATPALTPQKPALKTSLGAR